MTKFEKWDGPKPGEEKQAWLVPIKVDIVEEIAQRITGAGRIVGISPDGIITAEFEAGNLWDLHKLIEGDVLHDIRAVGNYQADAGNPVPATEQEETA